MVLIVFAQFTCTSLWFAGNAVVKDMQAEFDFGASAIGSITSAVQFGFIVGTLFFALLTIADRFSPSKVFFVSAVIGAISNLGVFFLTGNLTVLLTLRFVTGFFLAGIYPVGMKIASDYNEHGLGKALGYLVGALVVGTAFPHLVRDMFATLPWRFVIVSTSATALLGGFLVLLLVPDGPYIKKLTKIDLSAFFSVFKNNQFRAAAFGYFGHMWELYTFWAFVPVMLLHYNSLHIEQEIPVALMTFSIIAMGGLACVIGGYISEKHGSDKTAFYSLICSGTCCLLSLIMFDFSLPLFYAFLFFWGMTVIADSPQFSTLVASFTSAEQRGTALTIVNSIGFAITIVSIQMITWLHTFMDQRSVYVILVLGPIFGVLSMRKLIPRG